MKAILIDAEKKTVSEIDFKLENWKSIPAVLGCEHFEVHRVPGFPDEYFHLDEEGLLKPNKYFEYAGCGQPFGGRGLILGVGDGGYERSTNLTVDEVRKCLKFDVEFDPSKIEFRIYSL